MPERAGAPCELVHGAAGDQLAAGGQPEPTPRGRNQQHAGDENYPVASNTSGTNCAVDLVMTDEQELARLSLRRQAPA